MSGFLSRDPVLDNMKVSVLITTYNQEDLIAQAVNSVLEQEVSFDYEIVIGEDASTDRTREIVLELQQRHPDKIRLYLREAIDSEHDRALGMGGRTNFVKCLFACQGQYIALLDGDDYWTSPDKLRKQVEFLDAHSECAMCFHNAEILYEDQSRAPRNYCPADQKRFSTLEDLIKRNPIATSSVMFRRGLFEKFPEWFHEIRLGDWALHILNFQFGSAGYLDEVMASYRLHQRGFSGGVSAIQSTHDAISFYERVGKDLKFKKYHRLFKSALSKSYLDLAIDYDKAGERGRARECAVRAISLGPFDKDIPSRLRLKVVTRLYAPRVYRRLKSLLQGPLEKNL